MIDLFTNPDGASAQAQVVLAYLRGRDGLADTWDKERGEYAAKPTVARWHNCREQGYVISLHARDFKKQLNIAFFEHRNSDAICAVKWEQITINPPTVETAKFGNVYKDKHDVSHSVDWGEAEQMAGWIYDAMTDWYVRAKTAQGSEA